MTDYEKHCAERRAQDLINDRPELAMTVHAVEMRTRERVAVNF